MSHTWTLVRWGARVRARTLMDALRTPRGVASVAAVVLVAAAAWLPVGRLVRSTAAGETHPDAALAILLVGQAVLLLCVVACAPIFLIAALRPDADPARAFPFAAPDVLRLRLLGRVLLPVAAYLTLFHALFFLGSVALAFGGGAAVAVAYALATAAVLLPAGVAGAAAFRAWGGGGRRTGLTRALAPAVFLVLFALPLLVLPAVNEALPGALAALGAAGRRALYLLWPPLFASAAAARSAPAGVLVALATLALSAGLTWRALGAWASTAPLLLHEEDLRAEGGPVSRAHRAFRFSTSAPRAIALVRAFLAKDLLLPALRDPARHLGEVAVVLAGAVTWLVLLDIAGLRGAPDALLRSGTVLVALLLPLWAGFRWGLPCLGSEGRALAVLRPVLRAGPLFVVKLASVAAFTLPHAVLAAILVVGVAAVMGVPAAPLPYLAATAAGAALVLPGLGVALGFLLPGRPAGGGSSRLGQGAYALTAGVAAILFALADAGARLGLVAGAAAAVELAMPLAFTLLLTALLGGAAVVAVARAEP